jgi:penicillin G amidase
MRIVSFVLTIAITAGLIYVLNTTWKIGGQSVPALGKFLNPQRGCWQNAEPVNKDFNAELKFPQLGGRVTVYLDERLVPHIFAEKENDAYFVQGYLHAKFRLWQMELQTRVAAGRASEILGEAALMSDREFRRLGMLFAAENSLKEVEKDEVIKSEYDSYTAGVNAYIESLTESTLPLEYKLMEYTPEKWSNMKTAIFMKYMSYDLAGHDDDFEMTNAKSFFSKDDFDKLFPFTQDSSDPVIPKGTLFEKPKVIPVIPANADSAYLNNRSFDKVEEQKPDKENGSNNWAVSGSKTESGAPILCNDPHLTLTLPSVWYELQISAPTINVYGVGFPGAPGIMIGFNDSCAFGFTNSLRDVRDYFEIKFKDDTRKEYLYNGSWQQTKWRQEIIKIKDRDSITDSVAYVKLGEAWCPVMYDKTYSGGRNTNHKYYAVRWKAHDPSNELKAFNMLDHAMNYDDFNAAITNLHTPGQNAVFADKNGDIAIRTQGEWPAKWKGQGDFIMPGFDSSYLWQGMIPMDEIPFQHNPERGFVSSANQKPVDDSNYPYYVGRNYPLYRGIIINRKLSEMNNITPQDMMAMQTDNYNVFAEMTRPVLIKHLSENDMNINEKRYLDLLQNWNLRNDVGSEGATVFEVFWNNFYKIVYDDEYAKAQTVVMHPYESSLLEGILRDSSYKFLDNISTAQRETLTDDVTAAFQNAVTELKKIEEEGRLPWEKYKATQIKHLTRLNAFSRMNLPVGGNKNSINGTKSNHGPSWRMIVCLSERTEAYGIYPGGQSGNPGSKYYDDFIDYWVEGKYYPLWLMSKEEQNDKRVKWKINFSG